MDGCATHSTAWEAEGDRDPDDPDEVAHRIRVPFMRAPETAARHYENLLAPVPSWMMGGAQAALERGRRELVESGILDDCPRIAVDLGAGCGIHAIPMARAGARVVAVDSSAQLLDELGPLAEGCEVRMVRDDLLRFEAHLTDQPDLVLCMGDTLPHRPDRRSVTELIERVAARLAIGGRFLVSFRNYSTDVYRASGPLFSTAS